MCENCRNKKCVDHKFISIAPYVEWCEKCGTVRVSKYSEDYILLGKEIREPENNK